MRKTFLLFVAFALCWLGGKAVAEDYLMPQFGHQTVTVSAGSPVTFMDMNSYAGISSSNNNNSFATTIFKPAESGNSIKIEFENVDVRNDGSSWPANLSIYNGVFDVTSVTYPTATSGVTASSAFPATDKLVEKLDGTYTNLTYISADATGALSVCYVYRYAKAIQGWKATVSSITLDPMTITGATGNNSFVDGEVWSGKKNVAVAGLGITTEGYSSPDKLESFTFTCNNMAVLDPTALKLYAGQAASVAGLTEIAGTITESAGVYTFTLTTPQALSNGANHFSLGGNILSTAAFNATASVNITGIATAGGFTTFTTATPATLTVQPMYLMAENATYTISQPTNFYDEGGKDGKVVKGFDGKVVFTPATSGSKVKLTFNNINVFYTDYAANSTGYVDYIKVYNGNSTEEADLLWQLSQAEASTTTAIVLKSTAADGKLTITHKNNISYDSNLKDGWEAVVSEFVPQAMTVSSVSVTKETGTVSAGTEGKQVACIKVVTAETEPALTVASIALNTNNTYPQIKKAKLYYTKENSFSTSNLIGEATVDANTVTISKSNDINFREGDNYLWVVCDINELAQNGEKVNVTVTELAFTNLSSVSEFGSQSGELTIENKAVQACGSQTFTVLGDWAYTHTVTNEYNSKYLAEQCDQTVIFKPATAGNVIQVDYADYDVYYATSSYYTRAKYIVYDGEGTSGAILWQLDANGKKPTQLRSTTGAMTIVFNPNTTSSYYTGNGWHATVKEYTPKNMAILNTVVEQASTAIVSLGEEKAALLNVNIQTEGTLSPLTLDAVTVSLKGTEANISKVYLLQGTTVVAQATAAATTVLTLTTPVTLNEYDNEFSIAVDIKADATVEQTVDAALLSLTINGAAQSVSAGDPEGSRLIKNVLLLQASDNGTKQIGATSLMFYDDGGVDGTYTKNIEGYVTFVPEHEGYAVEVLVNNYKLSSGAPVKIYYGTSHDGDADATVEYNYSDPEKYKGQSFISSAADGSLTVYFKDQSYGSANDGWEFEIREHRLTDLSIESVTATSVASALQTVGAKDLKMLQIAVSVVGDRTPITIDAISVAANEYVDGTKLYQTGKVATFSDSQEFTAPYEITERGTYYFWVTADASEDANDEDIMTVSLTSIQSGANTIVPTTTETAQTKLAHGMSDVYVIGSSPTSDFPTVAAAIEALRVLGVEGNVTFKIEAGTYTGKVVLPEVAGVSAEATVTFCSATGNAADVVFSSDETSDTEGVWTVNGMDWLTLKNITFKSDKTGYAACLVLKNQSQHVTVDGCVLTTAVTGNSTSQNMQLVRVISEDADNANCNNFTVENSTFIGGYHALNLTQGSYASHPYRSDYIVRNNTFLGQEKLVIYTNFMNNLTIENNTISMTNVTNTDARAMDIRALSGHYVIAGNNINIQCTGTGYANAIYFATSGQTNCAEGTVVDIYNNAVYVETTASSPSSCLRFKWQREVNMTYNTLVLNGTYSTASALWLENFSNLALTAKNNLIQNIGTGYAVFGVKGTYSHNALYSASGNINNINATFADWKTAVGATDADANLNEQAVFASNSLLLLKEQGNLVSATPIATVTTDILGKPRAATPTIGAYEFDAAMLTIPVMAEGYPKALNVKDTVTDIVLKADNMGTAKVLVLAASQTAPSKETVLADGREVVLQKDAEATVTIDALTEETEYKAYVLLLSPVGDAADAVVATETFTTAWTLRPVQVTAIAAQTVEENADVTLTATLVNEYEQAKPYTYKWYTAYDETEIGNGATLNTTATRTTEYICCVTDRFNQKGYVSAHVKVAKAATAATFEEYNLPAGGNKYVDDAWADGVETYLYSGTYAFANTPNKKYNAYTGYVISADKSNVATGNYMTDQFRSAAGGAYEGNNFAVAYYSAPSAWFAGYNDPVTLTNTAEPQVINGFYITNSAYTLDAVLHGDYANDAFAQGDYLSLTISGYNGNDKTGETTFYLADYRSANASEHYALDTWKWLDLSGLGAVTRLEFSMSTTKSDEYGFTTPTYFCLDNFGSSTETYTRKNLTVGNYGTICLPRDVAAGDYTGAEFYKVLERTSDYITLEEVTELAAGQAYIFAATATTLTCIYSCSTVAAPAPASTANVLQGVFADGTVPSGMWFLHNNKLYLSNGSNAVAANRAYLTDLTPSAAPVPGRKHVRMPIHQTPTGLDEVRSTDVRCTKVLRDGVLYILKDGRLYNMQGQIVK
ncbi:MAG: DUF4465 domain-containing protein [Paludibacteraceae bacterium]|nr:DUF4465 domain-containing protein [Paludibacteraceae bacterium]